MRSRAMLLVFLAAGLAIAQARAQLEPPTDAEVAARETALALAGAFSNEGFKIRDGHWCGQLTEGESRLIQVNVYAGNQYWFSLGATPEAKKLSVTVYDETGKPLPAESYQKGATAAAGFQPETSGPYYVQVQELAGAPATFCLIYSYK